VAGVGKEVARGALLTFAPRHSDCGAISKIWSQLGIPLQFSPGSYSVVARAGSPASNFPPSDRDHQHFGWRKTAGLDTAVRRARKTYRGPSEAPLTPFVHSVIVPVMVRQIRVWTFASALLIAVSCGAQSLPSPEFEVADIHMVDPWQRKDLQKNIGEAVRSALAGEGILQGLSTPASTLRLYNLSMRMLIELAFKEVFTDGYTFRASLDNFYIKGVSNWADSTFYDLIARLPPNSSVDDERLMIQAVLRERFHLQVHREEKMMPVFALVKKKGDVHLQQAERPDGPVCSIEGTLVVGTRLMACDSVSMDFFAERMSTFVGRPVIDATRLAGNYNIRVDVVAMCEVTSCDPSAETVGPALAKLGLALEARKALMPVLVIDRLERIPTLDTVIDHIEKIPTEN
jgi:uncharacterized protein (TIGR03435 family)